jgi:hypothetical protein
MKKKHEIILVILASLQREVSLTTRDIFNEMEPADKGVFSSIDDVSNTLVYLREYKKWAENGISEIVKGKTTLTWKITKAGTEALKGTGPEQDDEMPSDVTAVPGIDQSNDRLTYEVDAGVKNGLMTLNPDDELDLPFIQIISALRAAYSKPDPVTIQRKEEKISTLSRLGALMSDDIKAVFDDIAKDLQKLESAA